MIGLLSPQSMIFFNNLDKFIDDVFNWFLGVAVLFLLEIDNSHVSFLFAVVTFSFFVSTV